MKKILLLFALGAGMIMPSPAQLLNGGFETWTSGLPNNWWGLVLPPYNLLSQTTDKHAGQFAVKLHVDDLNGQPLSSYLTTGNGNATSQPLTYVPLSISLWYKLIPVSGDEITLTALVYSGGAGAGAAAVTIPAASVYTYFSTPILYGVVPSTADSIAIILMITNPAGNNHIGSDAFFDDVAISPTSVGIHETDAADNFLVTPNPAGDFISIQVPAGAEGHVSLFSASGQQVSEAAFHKKDSRLVLDTSSLPSGIYLCRVAAGEKEYKKAVIVMRQP